MNAFELISEFELPADPSLRPEYRSPFEVTVGAFELPSTNIASVAGRLFDDACVAYDLGDAVFVNAMGNVEMFVPSAGDRVGLRFDPADETARNLAGAVVCNLGVSVLSLFRGLVPIHACGALIDGLLVGVMAPSGTGKSTLLNRLLADGAPLFCDDVLTLDVRGSRMVAYPSASLHRKVGTCEPLNGSPGPLAHVLPGLDEYWQPVAPCEPVLETTPLSALFVLEPLDYPGSPDTIEMAQLPASAGPPLLMGHTQGLWCAHSLIDTDRLIDKYEAISRAVPIFVLRYCRRLAALPVLAKMIREGVALAVA